MGKNKRYPHNLKIKNLLVKETHKFFWSPHKLSDSPRNFDESDWIVDLTDVQEKYSAVRALEKMKTGSSIIFSNVD